MFKSQFSDEAPQRKLQPWSGLGANQAEEGSNHKVVRDLNSHGYKKRKSTGGYQRKSSGKGEKNMTDQADPFSAADQSNEQPSQMYRPKAQSNI